MRGVLKAASNMPLSAVDRDAIVDGRERRAKTPSQANNFLNTMRALFSWAVENGRIEKDPTEGVKSSSDRKRVAFMLDRRRGFAL